MAAITARRYEECISHIEKALSSPSPYYVPTSLPNPAIEQQQFSETLRRIRNPAFGSHLYHILTARPNFICRRASPVSLYIGEKSHFAMDSANVLAAPPIESHHTGPRYFTVPFTIENFRCFAHIKNLDLIPHQIRFTNAPDLPNALELISNYPNLDLDEIDGKLCMM